VEWRYVHSEFYYNETIFHLPVKLHCKTEYLKAVSYFAYETIKVLNDSF
jgi:hypothetical protein